MTNGPDDQDLPPPPPPPPPSGAGRGLFARNDPDQPPPPPPRPPEERPPRPDPRVRQPQPPVEPGTDDNPFLLPNERDRMPVYGAPPLPIVPLALMVLAIAVGAVLFVMSREKEEGGITSQQAATSTVMRMDGLDITEAAFRREIATGISKGRIPCDLLSNQSPDSIAASLKLGLLRMEVPSTSGVQAKKDQKADDSSLLLAGQIVLSSCPKGAAPAPAPPGGQPIPTGTQAPAPPPGGQPIPQGTQAPPPGGIQPIPTGTQAAPGGTPRPATSPAPPAPAPGR